MGDNDGAAVGPWQCAYELAFLGTKNEKTRTWPKAQIHVYLSGRCLKNCSERSLIEQVKYKHDVFACFGEGLLTFICSYFAEVFTS